MQPSSTSFHQNWEVLDNRKSQIFCSPPFFQKNLWTLFWILTQSCHYIAQRSLLAWHLFKNVRQLKVCKKWYFKVLALIRFWQDKLNHEYVRKSCDVHESWPRWKLAAFFLFGHSNDRSGISTMEFFQNVMGIKAREQLLKSVGILTCWSKLQRENYFLRFEKFSWVSKPNCTFILWA